MDIIKFAILAR